MSFDCFFHNQPPVYRYSKSFLAATPYYIHRECHSFDSGAKVTSLSHTIYIFLDTFHSVVHNIDTELDAWLTFLSSDKPADIVKLVNAYPEFLSCYHDIMEFRGHPKELVTMYSEALAMLDRNPERYMVEESKKETEALKKVLNEALKEKDNALKEKDNTIEELTNALNCLQMQMEQLQHNQK